MASTYDLWTELAVNNEYGKFRRCLKGEIRGSWDEILEDEPKSKDDFQNQLINLVVDELGMDAHKNQVKYLRRTKKPENMPVPKWFKRIRFINGMLHLLSGGATVKSDEYLLENFVLENIPNKWLVQAELKGLDDNSGWSEMLTFLQTCEKYLNHKKQHPKEDKRPTEKGDRRRDEKKKSGSTTKSSGEIKNPCGFTGHSKHDYKDCKYNPRSKNFCGTQMAKKDFDEDGSKKKTSSGEQTCTEETKRVGFQIGPDSDSDEDEEFEMAEEVYDSESEEDSMESMPSLIKKKNRDDVSSDDSSYGNSDEESQNTSVPNLVLRGDDDSSDESSSDSDSDSEEDSMPGLVERRNGLELKTNKNSVPGEIYVASPKKKMEKH